MKRHKLAALAELRGWHLTALYQPQHLFVDNGRKHKRVAEPCDPWQALLSNDVETRCGQGATPEAAVRAAIPADLLASMRRLEEAVDSLRDCLQK